MNARYAGLFTLATIGGCSSAKTDGLGDVAPPPPPAVSSFDERKVDDLSSTEARSLCREDHRRMDYCMMAGVARDTPAECEEVVTACRAAITSSGNPQCDDFVAGGSGTCAVEVKSYLSCVDAWNAVHTCAKAGKWVEMPEECAAVVDACPRLRDSFHVERGTPPACGPETASRPAHKADDIHGLDGCRPAPSRFVVLGDSIADCSFVFDESKCARTLITEDIRRYSPDVKLEEYSVPGAFFSQLPTQSRWVQGGPGHVFVWIYAIGNDLGLRLIDYPGWEATLKETMAYFTDVERFPDGATFLLNTQFSPYDQCVDPINGNPSISMEEEETLQEVNRRVFLEVAEARTDTVAIDHYPGWLGHGINANLRGCPHCGSDNTPWSDGTHPNAVGNAQMAAKWSVAVERMLGGRCDE